VIRGFGKGALQDVHHRQILRTSGDLLTVDDISEGRNDHVMVIEVHASRAPSDAVEGFKTRDLSP
jgi:hypothetical protein